MELPQVNFERSEYESRVDAAADQLRTFVDAVLQTIDYEGARRSPEKWETVGRYFSGCAQAARMQGRTPGDGGERIAGYLEAAFRCEGEPLQDGFFEFMDWLANPGGFRPSALRRAIGREPGY